MKRYLMAGLVGSLPLLAHAAPIGDGWRWYDDPLPTTHKKPTPPAITRTISRATTKPLTPTQQLAKIQARYQDAKAMAVMHPSVDNTAAVMRWHQYFLTMSDTFGLRFQQALLKYPSLSYRATFPVESIARKVYHQGEQEKQAALINTLAAQGFGLMFVYRGHDAMANALAPSLIQLSRNWHLPLLGISQDGVLIAGIEKNHINDGRLSVKVTPAIFLINPQQHVKQAIAYGFISTNELLDNLQLVATHLQQDE